MASLKKVGRCIWLLLILTYEILIYARVKNEFLTHQPTIYHQ